MQVWAIFPLRFIKKYYRIAVKAKLKFEIFMARIQGVDIKEPDWNAWDKEEGHGDQTSFHEEEDYEKMKQRYYQQKSEGIDPFSLSGVVEINIPGVKKAVEVE